MASAGDFRLICADGRFIAVPGGVFYHDGSMSDPVDPVALTGALQASRASGSTMVYVQERTRAQFDAMERVRAALDAIPAPIRDRFVLGTLPGEHVDQRAWFGLADAFELAKHARYQPGLEPSTRVVLLDDRGLETQDNPAAVRVLPRTQAAERDTLRAALDGDVPPSWDRLVGLAVDASTIRNGLGVRPKLRGDEQRDPAGAGYALAAGLALYGIPDGFDAHTRLRDVTPVRVEEVLRAWGGHAIPADPADTVAALAATPGAGALIRAGAVGSGRPALGWLVSRPEGLAWIDLGLDGGASIRLMPAQDAIALLRALPGTSPAVLLVDPQGRPVAVTEVPPAPAELSRADTLDSVLSTDSADSALSTDTTLTTPDRTPPVTAIPASAGTGESSAPGPHDQTVFMARSVSSPDGLPGGVASWVPASADGARAAAGGALSQWDEVHRRVTAVLDGVVNSPRVAAPRRDAAKAVRDMFSGMRQSLDDFANRVGGLPDEAARVGLDSLAQRYELANSLLVELLRDAPVPPEVSALSRDGRVLPPAAETFRAVADDPRGAVPGRTDVSPGAPAEDVAVLMQHDQALTGSASRRGLHAELAALIPAGLDGIRAVVEGARSRWDAADARATTALDQVLAAPEVTAAQREAVDTARAALQSAGSALRSLAHRIGALPADAARTELANLMAAYDLAEMRLTDAVRGAAPLPAVTVMFRPPTGEFPPYTVGLAPDGSYVVARAPKEGDTQPHGFTGFDVFGPDGRPRGAMEARTEESGDYVATSSLQNHSDVPSALDLATFFATQVSTRTHFQSMSVINQKVQQIREKDYGMEVLPTSIEGSRNYRQDGTTANTKARARLESRGWTLPTGGFATPQALRPAWTSDDPQWRPVSGDTALDVYPETLDDGTTRLVSGRPGAQGTFQVVDPATGDAVHLLRSSTGPDGGVRWMAEPLSPTDLRHFAAVARDGGWTAASSLGERIKHKIQKRAGLRAEDAKALDFVASIVTDGTRLRSDLVLPGFDLYRLTWNGRTTLIRAMLDGAGRVIRVRRPLRIDEDQQRYRGHDRLTELRDAGWTVRTGHQSNVDATARLLVLDPYSGTAWRALTEAHQIHSQASGQPPAASQHDQTVLMMRDQTPESSAPDPLAALTPATAAEIAQVAEGALSRWDALYSRATAALDKAMAGADVPPAQREAAVSARAALDAVRAGLDRLRDQLGGLSTAQARFALDGLVRTYDLAELLMSDAVRAAVALPSAAEAFRPAAGGYPAHTVGVAPDGSYVVARAPRPGTTGRHGFSGYDVFGPDGRPRGTFETTTEETSDAVATDLLDNASEVRNALDLTTFYATSVSDREFFDSVDVYNERVQQIREREYGMRTQPGSTDGVRTYRLERVDALAIARARLGSAGWSLPSGDPAAGHVPRPAWTSEDPGWAPVLDGAPLAVVTETLDGGVARQVSGRHTADGGFEVVDPGTGTVVRRLHGWTAPDGGPRWSADLLLPADRRHWDSARSRAGGAAATAEDLVQDVVTNGTRLRADLVLPGFSLYGLPVDGDMVLVRALTDERGRVVQARRPLEFDDSQYRPGKPGSRFTITIESADPLADMYDAGWTVQVGHRNDTDPVSRVLTLNPYWETAWRTLAEAHAVRHEQTDAPAPGPNDRTVLMQNEMVWDYVPGPSAEQDFAAPGPSALSTVDDPFSLRFPDLLSDMPAWLQGRINRGQMPVPFYVHGAMDAAAAKTAFGIEIEFVLPADDRIEDEDGDRISDSVSDRLQWIGQRLYELGLIPSPDRQEFHSERAPGMWAFEMDDTVDGEIVSPLLTDTPKTWQDLLAIERVLAEFGATVHVRDPIWYQYEDPDDGVYDSGKTADMEAGGHVHVSSRALSVHAGTAGYARLAALYHRDQEVLYRLAGNPRSRFEHGYAERPPGWDPTFPYLPDAQTALDAQRGKKLGLSFHAVHLLPDDHPEWRLWRASQLAAVIQTQVKVSIGMQLAALDGSQPLTLPAGQPDLGRFRPAQAYGTPQDGWQIFPPRSQEQYEALSRLLSTIFARQADIAQATALFYLNDWAPGPQGGHGSATPVPSGQQVRWPAGRLNVGAILPYLDDDLPVPSGAARRLNRGADRVWHVDGIHVGLAPSADGSGAYAITYGIAPSPPPVYSTQPVSLQVMVEGGRIYLESAVNGHRYFFPAQVQPLTSVIWDYIDYRTPLLLAPYGSGRLPRAYLEEFLRERPGFALIEEGAVPGDVLIPASYLLDPPAGIDPSQPALVRFQQSGGQVHASVEAMPAPQPQWAPQTQQAGGYADSYAPGWQYTEGQGGFFVGRHEVDYGPVVLPPMPAGSTAYARAVNLAESVRAAGDRVTEILDRSPAAGNAADIWRAAVESLTGFTRRYAEADVPEDRLVGELQDIRLFLNQAATGIVRLDGSARSLLAPLLSVTVATGDPITAFPVLLPETSRPAAGGLPPYTVGVAPDGSYVVAKTPASADRRQPGFAGFLVYGPDGSPRGTVDAQTVEDDDAVVTSTLYNRSDVPGALDLTMFYATGASDRRYFRLSIVLNEKVQEISEQHYRMEVLSEPGAMSREYRQERAVVHATARERLESRGWTLPTGDLTAGGVLRPSWTSDQSGWAPLDPAGDGTERLAVVVETLDGGLTRQVSGRPAGAGRFQVVNPDTGAAVHQLRSWSGPDGTTRWTVDPLSPSDDRYYADLARDAGRSSAQDYVQQIVSGGTRLRDDLVLPGFGLYRGEGDDGIVLVRALVDADGRVVRARRPLELDKALDEDPVSYGRDQLEDLRAAGWTVRAGHRNEVDEVARTVTLNPYDPRAWLVNAQRLRDALGSSSGRSSSELSGPLTDAVLAAFAGNDEVLERLAQERPLPAELAALVPSTPDGLRAAIAATRRRWDEVFSRATLALARAMAEPRVKAAQRSAADAARAALEQAGTALAGLHSRLDRLPADIARTRFANLVNAYDVAGGRLVDALRGAAPAPAASVLFQPSTGTLPPYTVGVAPDGSYVVARAPGPGDARRPGFTGFDVFGPDGRPRGAMEVRTEETGDHVATSSLHNHSDVAGALDLATFFATGISERPYFQSMSVINEKVQQIRRRDYGMDLLPSSIDGSHDYRQQRTAAHARARARLESRGWTLATGAFATPQALRPAWASEDPAWTPSVNTVPLDVVPETMDDGSTRWVSGRPGRRGTFQVVDPVTGDAMHLLRSSTGPDGGTRWTAEPLSPTDLRHFSKVARDVGWTAATSRRDRVKHKIQKGAGLRDDDAKALDFVAAVVTEGTRLRDDLVLPGFGLYQLTWNGRTTMVRAKLGRDGQVVRVLRPLQFDEHQQRYGGHEVLTGLWEAGWTIRTGHHSSVDATARLLVLDPYSGTAWRTLTEARQIRLEAAGQRPTASPHDRTVFMTAAEIAPVVEGALPAGVTAQERAVNLAESVRAAESRVAQILDQHPAATNAAVIWRSAVNGLTSFIDRNTDPDAGDEDRLAADLQNIRLFLDQAASEVVRLDRSARTLLGPLLFVKAVPRTEISTFPVFVPPPGMTAPSTGYGYGPPPPPARVRSTVDDLGTLALPARLSDMPRWMQQRITQGLLPIPFYTRYAMDGAASRVPFGIEIEFVLPANDRIEGEDDIESRSVSAWVAHIGRRLYELGLTASAERQDNPVFVPGKWTFVSDGTVDGEIVSPILVDSPETWQALLQIEELLAEAGATVHIQDPILVEDNTSPTGLADTGERLTKKAGSHVHVSSRFLTRYAGAEGYARLAALYHRDREVLYRLAGDPRSDFDHGYEERSPGWDPDYSVLPDAATTLEAHRIKRLGLTFNTVHLLPEDHPEWRLWRGSLLAAVIQTQVKISIGMQLAALDSTQPVGLPSSQANLGRFRSSGMAPPPLNGWQLHQPEGEAPYQALTLLLSTIFTRTADMAQATALFYLNDWAPSWRPETLPPPSWPGYTPQAVDWPVGRMDVATVGRYLEDGLPALTTHRIGLASGTDGVWRVDGVPMGLTELRDGKGTFVFQAGVTPSGPPKWAGYAIPLAVEIEGGAIRFRGMSDGHPYSASTYGSWLAGLIGQFIDSRSTLALTPYGTGRIPQAHVRKLATMRASGTTPGDVLIPADYLLDPPAGAYAGSWVRFQMYQGTMHVLVDALPAVSTPRAPATQWGPDDYYAYQATVTFDGPVMPPMPVGDTAAERVGNLLASVEAIAPRASEVLARHPEADAVRTQWTAAVTALRTFAAGRLPTLDGDDRIMRELQDIRLFLDQAANGVVRLDGSARETLTPLLSATPVPQSRTPALDPPGELTADGPAGTSTRDTASVALTGAQLRELWQGVVESADRAAAGTGDRTLAECLPLVQAFVARVHPGGRLGHGVRLGRTREEPIPGRDAENWLGDHEDWQRFGGWTDLGTRLGTDPALGKKSIAVVLTERAGSPYGHVYAAYHTEDQGVLWLNLAEPGAAPTVGVPGELPGDADTYTRAIVVDPKGVVVPAGDRVVESDSRTAPHLDPADSRGYRGGGVEAERTMPMELPDGVRSDTVIAATPDQGIELLTDTKLLYERDGTYHLTPVEEDEWPGRADITELRTGVLGILPGEENRIPDTDEFWQQLEDIEQRFEDVDTEPGRPAEYLTEVLDGGVLRMVPGAEETTIGLPPEGDEGGNHVHLSFGVPTELLKPFLSDVTEGTWRDSRVTYTSDLGQVRYRTKAGQQEGAEFGAAVSGLLAEFLGAHGLAADERVGTAVEGVMTLVYSHSAGYLDSWIPGRNIPKAHVATLSRHDHRVLWGDLPWWAAFGLSLRAGEIRDALGRLYLERNDEFLDLMRLAGEDNPEFAGITRDNWATYGASEKTPVGTYVDSALTGRPMPPREVWGNITTFPRLDTNGGRLRHGLAVLEVRSYGARRVTMAQTRDNFRHLAGGLRTAYARIADLDPLRTVPLRTTDGPVTGSPVTAAMFRAVAHTVAGNNAGAAQHLRAAVQAGITVADRNQWSSMLVRRAGVEAEAGNADLGARLWRVAAAVAQPVARRWLAEDRISRWPGWAAVGDTLVADQRIGELGMLVTALERGVHGPQPGQALALLRENRPQFRTDAMRALLAATTGAGFDLAHAVIRGGVGVPLAEKRMADATALMLTGDTARAITTAGPAFTTLTPQISGFWVRTMHRLADTVAVPDVAQALIDGAVQAWLTAPDPQRAYDAQQRLRTVSTEAGPAAGTLIAGRIAAIRQDPAAGPMGRGFAAAWDLAELNIAAAAYDYLREPDTDARQEILFGLIGDRPGSDSDSDVEMRIDPGELDVRTVESLWTLTQQVTGGGPRDVVVRNTLRAVGMLAAGTPADQLGGYTTMLAQHGQHLGDAGAVLGALRSRYLSQRVADAVEAVGHAVVQVAAALGRDVQVYRADVVYTDPPMPPREPAGLTPGDQVATLRGHVDAAVPRVTELLDRFPHSRAAEVVRAALAQLESAERSAPGEDDVMNLRLLLDQAAAEVVRLDPGAASVLKPLWSGRSIPARPVPAPMSIGPWKAGDLGAMTAGLTRPVLTVDLSGRTPDALADLERALRAHEWWGEVPVVVTTLATRATEDAFEALRERFRPVTIQQTVAGGTTIDIEMVWRLIDQGGATVRQVPGLDAELFRVASGRPAVPHGTALPPVLAGLLTAGDGAEQFQRANADELDDPGVRDALDRLIAADPDGEHLAGFRVALGLPSGPAERLAPAVTSVLAVEPAYTGGPVPASFAYDFLAQTGGRDERFAMDGLLFQIVLAGRMTPESALELLRAAARTAVDRAVTDVFEAVAAAMSLSEREAAGDLHTDPRLRAILAKVESVSSTARAPGMPPPDCVDPVDRTAFVGRLDALRDMLRASGQPARASVIEALNYTLANC